MDTATQYLLGILIAYTFSAGLTYALLKKQHRCNLAVGDSVALIVTLCCRGHGVKFLMTTQPPVAISN